MYRQLYQMGGIGTLPMDFGQPLQVPQQQQPMFTTTGSAASSDLLNYGQTGLRKAGGTPLSRPGYQEGGITDFYKAEEPIIPRIENIGGLLDQAEKSIGEPQNNFMSPLATTFSRFGMQEGGMGMDQMMQPPMQGQGTMPQITQGDNALLTIIQLLIEQGIPPEEAQELAKQILQVFAQGGEPAVEAFANQLEQQEMLEERTMMARGGLTSIDRARDMLQSRAPSGEFLAYINPQEAGILRLMGGAGQDVNVRGVPSFFVKKLFKSASKAVKSIAKSSIGRIALTIGATMLMGPAGLNLGAGIFEATSPFVIGAINAGAANLLVQGITTGKFNPKEALLSAAAGGALSGLTAGTTPSTGLTTDPITGTITQPSIPGSLESGLGQNFAVSPPDITGSITQPSSFFSPTEYGSALSTPPSSIGLTPPSSVGLTPPSSVGFESDISSMTGTGYAKPFTLDQASLDPAAGAGSQIYNPGVVQTEPDIFQKGIASVQDFGTKLINDPIGTIGSGIKSTYELAEKYPAASILAATAAIGALTPQQPGEPDDSYKQRKAEHDAKVAQYITQYGGGTKVYSPSFYAMEGAVDPFAGRSTYAADGGQITNRQNYFFGSKVSAVATPQSGGGTGGGSGMGGLMARLIQQNPQMFKPQGTTSYEGRYRDLISTNFIDENRNGIDDRQETSYGGRIGYEYGSMPMGEPRRNPAGIMELDYRKKGGFVPPVGIKEKADDIPAMLSNNEFVFTADAVRNAGNGNVNKGAERMYGLMKQLEAGGVV